MPGEMALSPNGHGGVIQALQEAGLLDRLQSQGVTDCYYFQVDNPLVKIADSLFIGHHLVADAEMSLKVLAKLYPMERMGNLVELDGRCRIIEYTELPKDLAEQKLPDGQLRIWAGSPAIHLFQLKFLQRLGRGEITLPYHIARKTVPYINEAGQLIKPEKPNALKFERFVFDALPLWRSVLSLLRPDRKEDLSLSRTPAVKIVPRERTQGHVRSVCKMVEKESCRGNRRESSCRAFTAGSDGTETIK